MPKITFYNLDDKKREKITQVLIEEFELFPLQDSTVKHIVERLNISRGSFYQYFESLTESYFYILEKELSEVHLLFRKLVKKYDGDLNSALEQYGSDIFDMVLHGERRNLYKNRYLYWNAQLEAEWNKYTNKNKDGVYREQDFCTEVYRYIGAIIHYLIQRLFLDNMDKKSFLMLYKKYMMWIKGGIENVSLN